MALMRERRKKEIRADVQNGNLINNGYVKKCHFREETPDGAVEPEKRRRRKKCTSVRC